MTRVKALIALILAVLWLPVTTHCGLEGLPGLEFLVCCTHEDAAAPHEDEDCEADACAVVESGFYKLQDYEDLVVPSAEIAAEIPQASTELHAAPLTAARAPSDLAVGWQFSCRAAAPVRAPSSLL